MTNKIKVLATACGLALLSGLSYALLGKFGTIFVIPSTSLSVFWPPDAGTLAILLLSHRRYWLFIAVGSWLGDFPNEYSMSGSFQDSVILATLDSMMVLAPAFIIRRYAGDIIVKNCIRWFVWLFASYCLFSVPLAGLIVAVAVYGHNYTLTEIFNNSITWTLSSAPAALILIPLVVAGSETFFTRPESVDIDWRNPRISAIFLGYLLIIVSCLYYEFMVYYPNTHDVLNIYVPVLFAMAYVYGLIGAGIGSSIVLVMSGITPFYLENWVDQDPIAVAVFHIQVTEFANIAGAMLLACVTTSSRFVNRALADANLRFRDIAASTAELLWESDENDCFTYCSSDTHLHATHMVGRRIKEIFAPTAEEYQINQAAWDKRDQAMMERRPFRMIEFHVMGEDGQREIMSVSGIPVLDDNNQFRGYRGATNNITSKHGEMALQSAKAAAEAATRAKSAFLAHMSHEIRTPLTAILGFAESLIDCEQPAADRSLAIHTIIRNGRHLTSLISDILDFSKIESERIEIEKIPIPFLNLLSDIHALGLGQAKDKGLEFSVHYLPPLPAVVTSDPTRIKQILINLIGNAVKFTPAPGAVRLIVSLDVENAQMMFSIQDTGIGISAMERQSLFEPFVQADISTTRSFGGTGLGLAISRGLARRLGGDIRIISDKDQGSLFVVTLPTGSLEGIALIHGSDGFDTDSHLVQVVLRAPCLAGRVLVAEDNPDNQRLISWLIRRTGASVVLAGNGQEAVERAQNEDFDLVLMDVQMPVMGGVDATALLRLTGFDHPIVALTANTAESDKTQALEAGCDGFLSKPIDQADFFATLSCHLPKGDGPTTESTAIFANPPDLKDDPEFQQMRERFTRELPGQLRDIAAACQGQDWPGVSSLAHRLKGVAASFDMPEATRIAGAIEFQILHGDYNQAGHLVLELVALCPHNP